jgi:hypothetical protein
MYVFNSYNYITIYIYIYIYREREREREREIFNDHIVYYINFVKITF